MPRHWHTIENTPGYIPESDPGCFSNRKDAVSYAVSLVRECRESGYRMHGSGVAGYWYGTSPDYTYDLGRAVSVLDVSVLGWDCDPRNSDWE